MASLTIEGNWIASTPIPDQSLETRERRLSGKDKELLLALARKILRWLPEERPSAEDLFEDEFLIQWIPVELRDPERATNDSSSDGRTSSRESSARSSNEDVHKD